MFIIFVKIQSMNPFIIKGYAGAKYFCDRDEETARIIHAIQNQRNLTLVSLRKMGKTGLIFHVFEKLQQQKHIETIYLDIYQTENLNGFINQLGTSILRMKRSFNDKFREFLQNFRSIRPVLTVDQLTGSPSLSFKISNEEDARLTLEDLFILLQEKSQTTPLVVAIDEFQQIAKYPEKNVEALLRGLIQNMHEVSFIFSGSNKTLLAQMFGDATRPFYQSTEIMFLEEIQQDNYADFIQKQFKTNGKRVQPEVPGAVLNWTRVYTFYVQYLCNKIFEISTTEVTMKDFSNLTRQVMLEFQPFYLEYRNLITRPQWNLLHAIAKENGIQAVTSGEFIIKYSLNSASTVKRGIESLLDKEMIYRKQDNYFVYDLFFSRWLETQ